MTVVGDVAQTSSPAGARSWSGVLDDVAAGRWHVVEMTVNYRTPAEVMAVAAGVLAAVDPDARPPSSVRETGEHPVAIRAEADARAAAVADAAADLVDAVNGGTVAVLTPRALLDEVRAAVTRRSPEASTGEVLEARLSVLAVREAKGLEFDGVVVVEPADVVDAGRNGMRDLYVALTRATQRLAVVHARPLPAALAQLCSRDEAAARPR